MDIFGRKVSLRIFFIKAVDITSMLLRSFAFKDAASLWSAYLNQTSPKLNRFTTRDGYQLILSNNPHDAITVMVIFNRKEYGVVDKGSTVFDVGANIGVFSLYAARCGAKKVYAFEPNKESYEVLLNNIKVNKLEKIIIPFNLAVGSRNGELISIPKISSPYNAIIENNVNGIDYDSVPTISLPFFIDKNKIEKIDFLKMDCEGAEYPIIYSMNDEYFKRIDKFRLEHHSLEEKEKLVALFSSHGFRKTKDRGSIIWFDR